MSIRVRGPPPAPAPTNDSTPKEVRNRAMTETKLPANEEVSRYKEELGL
jgi:hypothetical protein